MDMTRRRKLYSVLAFVTLVLIAGFGVLFVMSITARRPHQIGLHDGKLAPCPDSPNCVSTQAEALTHRIHTIPFTGNADRVSDVIVRVIKRQPRSVVVQKSVVYVYAEFRSALFQFVDDVEFFVDAEAGEIHFRSASRVGYSDMGVNRQRMENLRVQIEQALVAM